MLRALNRNNISFLAWDAIKENKPYFCPECKGEVVLRKGKIKIHHYAHKPPVNCIYGYGESEIHFRIKKQLYEYLMGKKNCKKCEIERHLGTVRPDISLYINDVPVAIEIQKSTIDIRLIKKRMEEYYKKKIAVIWIIPVNKPSLQFQEKEEVYVHRALEWEIYLHALNYGKLYYWQGDNSVIAYHFKALEIYKDYSEWYNEYGELQSAGDYFYYAKKLKLCSSDNKKLFLDLDFIINVHKAYSNSHLELPECYLYKDKYKNWWK